MKCHKRTLARDGRLDISVPVTFTCHGDWAVTGHWIARNYFSGEPVPFGTESKKNFCAFFIAKLPFFIFLLQLN